MGKFLAAFALALACAASAPVAARQAGVRVGPEAEEHQPDAPARKNEGAAGEAKDAKPANDKANGAANRPAGRSSQEASKSQTPANVSAAVPAVGAGAPNATSDAPPKPGPAVGVPVSNPSKGDESGGAATNPSDGNAGAATAKAPANNPGANASGTNASGNNGPAATPTAANPAAAPVPNPATANPLPSPAPLTSLYRVGVGDVLDIRLLNQPDTRQSTLYTVLTGGLIEYPLIRGHVAVAGMTTDELSAQLVAELRHRGVFERPQVRVSVREYASHAVLVSGLVSDPGTKILRREAVPLYVVVAEAQPKPEAGRAVVTSLATGKTTSVDLLDAAGMNFLVQQGDVVNLIARPPEFFYIGGEISQPGQKSFHHGMTLTQGLLASGGVTAQAGAKVKVLRQGADGRLAATEYNLKDIEGGVAPDPALQPGDRVEVSRASGRK